MKRWKLHMFCFLAAITIAGVVENHADAQGAAATGGAYVQGATPDGTAPTTNPLLIAGLNGGLIKDLQTDASKNLMVNVQNIPAVDPCESSSTAKSSASIAFSTATTTAIVSAVAGKTVYICNVTFTMSSGTTPTIVFKSGTGGTCGTGTVTFTGTMALSTTIGTLYTFGGAGHTNWTGVASGEVCYTTGGTSPTGNGWATYVQL